MFAFLGQARTAAAPFLPTALLSVRTGVKVFESNPFLDILTSTSMQVLKRSFLLAGWLSIVFAPGLFAAQDTPASEAGVPLKTAASPKRKPSVAANLVFDADTKYFEASLTDTNALFKFNLTNLWTNEITVDRIETSCGCTLGTLPANPWHIGPGEHGVVGATVNLNGKPAGLMTKTLTLYLSTNGNYIGTRVATVKVAIPAPAALEALSEADRKAAMIQAKADPRKIFTEPKCAECHVKPGSTMSAGDKIYAADCGICHDSPNRDSSVPDLHALKVPTNLDYWTAIITYGKTNTMMPAFASFKGGPLSESQVHALADYIASSEFAHASGTTNAAAKSTIQVGQ